ncbi:iron ABC transporter permease [Saccharibacillus sacchari]|uniref:Iron ABC transporter permease n=1 Tax=Saccharibacillus sacchari TaxID=456493 RepID=A0ACC6PIH6_9BACL
MTPEQVAKARSRRIWLVSVLMTAVALLVIGIGLNTGKLPVSPSGVIRTLLGNGTAAETMALYDIRLPRILVTILAGAGLGVAGMVFQGVSRNALADPGILGINNGAAFGLMIYISFFVDTGGQTALWIPLFAFGGGSAVAAAVFLLSYDRHRGLLPMRLILVGIAVAAGVSAATLILSLRLDEDTYAFAARWLAGNVWGREWIHVWALFPWVLAAGIAIYTQSAKLDLYALGDELVLGLGQKPTRGRLVLLALAVALSCACVAIAGGIGFIGLAAPHIARKLVGPQHRYALPIAALVGVNILVLADTMGRSLFDPNDIPAGIMVAALGGPYFLYLLLRKKNIR